MGYNNLNDLIKHGKAEKQSANNPKPMSDFDVSLAGKRFLPITLGSSPPVEFYDETKGSSEMGSLLAAQSCEAFFTNSIGAAWVVDSDSPSEAWTSLYSGPPNTSSSIFGVEHSLSLPLLSRQTMPLETEEILDHSSTVIESFESSVESLLDRCISCVPGLSKRLYHQLENCSFHTLRKLLHHFPRTYTDLQVHRQNSMMDSTSFLLEKLYLPVRALVSNA